MICLYSSRLSCGGQEKDQKASANKQAKEPLADSAHFENLMAIGIDTPYWESMFDMFHEMVGDYEEDSTMMAKA
ncbi:MAG: hypothetical protein BRD50_07240 [Bacteroidetes bacterium SW_11_45_7]|nr:MAG: hypothetical protein BRD50_07240 [Bacteroidetes bacterium SW_11_45_7]